jgi:RNA polymerase sigma factor (sigma-70 family)
LQDAVVAAPASGRAPKQPQTTEQLVLETIRDHAEALLRVARRNSLCADDAHDAYQRAVEIFLRNAERLDPERASRWLYTVCKHEAMAVRRQRQGLLGHEEPDLDALESRTTPSPEEHAISAERVARSAEALRRLKPQEVRALWLRAEGHSYAAICEQTGWTYTKVNRCLAEGRASFLARYAGIESGEECLRLAPALSAMVDGEASAEQLVELRPHLRHCGGCRAAVRELHDSSRPLALVLPVAGLAGGGDPAASVLGRALHGFTRALESLAHGVHERAASLAIRGQALVEGASAAKLTAIAASAVAVAGGGAVVVHGSAEREHPHRHAAQRTLHRAAAPAPRAAASAPARRASSPPATHAAKRHAHVRHTPADPVESDARTAPATPAPPPSQPQAAPASAPAPPAGAEFGFESR